MTPLEKIEDATTDLAMVIAKLEKALREQRPPKTPRTKVH